MTEMGALREHFGYIQHLEKRVTELEKAIRYVVKEARMDPFARKHLQTALEEK